MSPEARSPDPDPRRRVHWGRDVASGALIALPVALLLSQISAGSYRSGGAAVACLVVLGLAMRWTVTLGAAPVLWLAMVAQITHDFRDAPKARNVVGAIIVAASFAVVILALRRWEGDRRHARDEAQARMRNERRLQALVDLAHHFASVGDRSALLSAVEWQVPLAAGSSGAILVTRDDDRVEFPAVAGHDPALFPARLPAEYLDSGTPAVDVLRSGHPIFCGTTDELLARYPGLDDFVTRSGQHAWAALPVPDLGVVVLTWREEQMFSRAQRAFLETIANLFSAAAERIRIVERSELLRFAAAFDAMVDGVGIHRAVRDASGRVVDFEVEYLNPSSVVVGQRGRFVGRRMRDLWPDSPTLPFYARVVETGEPFVLEDTDVTALGGPYSDVEAVSLRASRLDPERMVLVVRDVSERARLVREIREANDMFEAAQELAHVGSWRYDFVTDQLEWSAELYRIAGVPEGTVPARPTDGRLLGFEHPDDVGRITAVIRDALEARSPFAFDMRIVRQSDGETRDVATTGIVIVGDDGAVTGVRGATQDVTVARRAERSRRAALDALAHQREAVAALQRVILPPELPVIPGAVLSAHYRAATLSDAVGGDWYDAFDAPDGRVVIAIGDVAGHGVECAALANLLRVSVRVRVGDGMAPAEILATLDREITDGFVTCWLSVYDPVTRSLQVANAGHPPAVLTRCGGAHPVAGHTVPPLGTRRVPVVHEHDLVLEPGDMLVLYTDGLVERRGEVLDRGLERLELASPLVVGVSDPALALVERLAPDAADDVCVVTLRID